MKWYHYTFILTTVLHIVILTIFNTIFLDRDSLAEGSKLLMMNKALNCYILTVIISFILKVLFSVMEGSVTEKYKYVPIVFTFVDILIILCLGIAITTIINRDAILGYLNNL